jgi:hypothetical protein
MFDHLTVMSQIPDTTWLTRLRRGNFLWLSKEKEFGIVEWEYEDDRHNSGRIGFRRFTNSQWKNETWMVRPNGQGINFSQLFMPVENHVPADLPPPPKSELDQLKKRLKYLEERLEALEVDIADLNEKDAWNVQLQLPSPPKFQISTPIPSPIYEIGSEKPIDLGQFDLKVTPIIE